MDVAHRNQLLAKCKRKCMCENAKATSKNSTLPMCDSKSYKHSCTTHRPFVVCSCPLFNSSFYKCMSRKSVYRCCFFVEFAYLLNTFWHSVSMTNIGFYMHVLQTLDNENFSSSQVRPAAAAVPFVFFVVVDTVVVVVLYSLNFQQSKVPSASISINRSCSSIRSSRQMSHDARCFFFLSFILSFCLLVGFMHSFVMFLCTH